MHHAGGISRSLPTLNIAVAVYWFAIATSVPGTLLYAFKYQVGDYWGDWNGALASAAAVVAWLLGLTVSVLYAIAARCQSSILRTKPVFVQAATPLCILMLASSGIEDHFEYRLNQHTRREVIALVENAALLNAMSNRVELQDLPPGYGQLSTGGGQGKILVSHEADITKILFYRYKGIFFHEFSGYAYVSDGSTPGARDLRAFSLSSRPLEPNWFWVDSR